MTSPLERKNIHNRDKSSCYHCGETDNLQIHHRKNRGMGGSKLLDRYDNLILVCAAYNYAMESDPKVQKQALEYGHKIHQWDDFSKPVFDIPSGIWYQLDTQGKRTPAIEETNEEQGLF